MNDSTFSRRDLLKSATLAGAAITLNTKLANAEALLLEPPLSGLAPQRNQR